jgi:phosphatidate cytidylyltransferase
LTGAFGSNLARRVATAVVALPLLLLAVSWGPPSLVLALVALALLVGLREFFDLVRAAHVEPLPLVGTLTAVAFFMDTALPGILKVPLWPAAVVGLLCAALARRPDPPGGLSGAALTLLGAAYLGGLGGTIGALRDVEPLSDGAFRILLLLGIVMGADTAAFFVGHAVGRHPLAPSLSPGKTVEGVLGGLVGGALGALLVRRLGLPTLGVPQAVLLGVLVAALSVLGDLFESFLKRWAGLKDSGALFPGHGGMLDRLDSLLFGAPLLYYYFVAFRSSGTG